MGGTHGRDARREGGHVLAASVPECQEALSILLLRCGCVRSRHLVRFRLSAESYRWRLAAPLVFPQNTKGF